MRLLNSQVSTDLEKTCCLFVSCLSVDFIDHRDDLSYGLAGFMNPADETSLGRQLISHVLRAEHDPIGPPPDCTLDYGYEGGASQAEPTGRDGPQQRLTAFDSQLLTRTGQQDRFDLMSIHTDSTTSSQAFDELPAYGGQFNEVDIAYNGHLIGRREENSRR
ncbi:unnamed protein product [Protopolystoma xenopodis]|uniref:Uncharacterized protein n=1 Tax=Protopolystoma xenopodis TaxID=117903 RepID=A0A448X082_9PLAT|nr:unnamed protein product [Protopolystoma xenopodis]